MKISEHKPFYCQLFPTNKLSNYDKIIFYCQWRPWRQISSAPMLRFLLQGKFCSVRVLSRIALSRNCFIDLWHVFFHFKNKTGIQRFKKINKKFTQTLTHTDIDILRTLHHGIVCVTVQCLYWEYNKNSVLTYIYSLNQQLYQHPNRY